VRNAGKLSAMNMKGLSAISFLQRGPIYIAKPHILSQVSETGFCDLTGKFSLNSKNKISAVQCQMKAYG
jgi:hypothetical protein